MLKPLSVVLVALLALAQAGRPAHAEPRRVRDTSITIEPIYLVLPMLDVTVEHRLGPHVALSGTAGYGRLVFGLATLWELAGASNFYLRRRATGAHLGFELRYLGGGMSKLLDPNQTSNARERVAGAYVGYKWVASYGLTAVLQMGVGRMDITGSSEGDSSQIIPVANFTAGWSI